MPTQNYIKICPKCGSDKVSASGALFGVSDYCKACGHSSNIFPEIVKSEVEEFRKQLKRNKEPES